jgi:Tfp pilus assembly protein PilF
VIKHSDMASGNVPQPEQDLLFQWARQFANEALSGGDCRTGTGQETFFINPKMVAELNSLLGDAYNATKAYDKSDKAYDDALAVDPANEAVLNNYSYYLALRKTNLEKAEKMSSL